MSRTPPNLRKKLWTRACGSIMWKGRLRIMQRGKVAPLLPSDHYLITFIKKYLFLRTVTGRSTFSASGNIDIESLY